MSKVNIGYYFAAFDPINQANLEQAIKFRDDYHLKTVFLIPERSSTVNQYTHIVHRMKLIDQAIKIHHSLKSYEASQKILNIQKIINSINYHNSANLIMLNEAVVFEHLHQQFFLKYLSKNHFVVNASSLAQLNQLKIIFHELKIKNYTIWLNENLNQHFSFNQVLKNQSVRGLLNSSKRYIIDNWLYLKPQDFV